MRERIPRCSSPLRSSNRSCRHSTPWSPRNWCPTGSAHTDRKSTRLNSSHLVISYAVFCLKKKDGDAEQYPLCVSARQLAKGTLFELLQPGDLEGLSLCFLDDVTPPELFPFSPHASLPV